MTTLLQVYEKLGKFLKDHPDLESSNVVIQPRDCFAEPDFEIYVADTEVSVGNEGTYYLSPEDEVPEDGTVLQGSDRVVVFATYDPPEFVPED